MSSSVYDLRKRHAVDVIYREMTPRLNQPMEFYSLLLLRD